MKKRSRSERTDPIGRHVVTLTNEFRDENEQQTTNNQLPSNDIPDFMCAWTIGQAEISITSRRVSTPAVNRDHLQEEKMKIF
jgi:hypothetical protein